MTQSDQAEMGPSKPTREPHAAADSTATAGNSTRRQFLKSGTGALAAAAGAGAGVVQAETSPLPIPPTNKQLGRGVVTTAYGMPSKFEADVIRRNVEWLTPDTMASISFTPLQDLHGIVTPAGVHFERHHAGAVDVDPAEHVLAIHGMVDRPMKFTVDDLKRMPSHTAFHFLECPANGAMEWRGVQMESVQFTHGMIACSEWTGVRLSTLMELVGVDPASTWFYAEGADGAGLQRSVPLPGAKDQFGKPLSDFDQNNIHKDVMVCYAQNGEALRAENGYPIRLLVPGCEANMSIKWLRRLKFADKPLVTYQETRHYTEVTNDGKIRQFSLVNEASSVITYPSPGHALSGPGFHEIRGLAWSGRGKITGVDVSIDGGRNWETASLVEPVMNKCLTRFTFPFNWDGAEHLIMSRAIDETGYVQPTLTQLREARGTNTIYHKNSIQAWHIAETGEVSNVQVS